MPPGLRFRPPAVEFTPELRFVLLRGFGPRGLPFLEPVEPVEVERVSEALQLSARIASRQPATDLVRDLGTEVARRLAARRLSTIATNRELTALLAPLAAAASARGVPVVLLKYAALHARGLVPLGLRAAGDVDLLLPASAHPAADTELRRLGFEGDGRPAARHQLPRYVDARGRVVEVHRHLPGVRKGGTGFATFEDLAREGGLERAAGLPAGCWVPALDLLLAHAIVHGLRQHGFAPLSYPLTRMLGDVIDILSAASEPGLMSRTLRWIGHDVDAEMVAGLESVCRHLATGDGCLFEPDADPSAGLLLRHVVAGLLDRSYSDAMKLDHLLNPLSDQPRLVAVFLAARELVFEGDGRATRAVRLARGALRQVATRVRGLRAA